MKHGLPLSPLSHDHKLFSPMLTFLIDIEMLTLVHIIMFLAYQEHWGLIAEKEFMRDTFSGRSLLAIPTSKRRKVCSNSME